MTKKEIAAQEREIRIRFVNGIYRKALNLIAVATKGSQKSMQLRITHKGGNRYVHLSIYGSKLTLLAYKNGNIAIQLKEFCHDDYQEVVFEYDKSLEKQYDFLDFMEEYYSFLVGIFSGEGLVDPHIFMDYISWNHSIIAATEAVKKEWNYKDPTSDELKELRHNLNKGLLSTSKED